MRSEISRASMLAWWSVRWIACALVFCGAGCASSTYIAKTKVDTRAAILAEIGAAFRADEAEWPDARDRLVCDAEAVLSVLETSPIGATELYRVKDLISRVLLNRISYDVFRSAYPALHQHVAKEIDARRQSVKTFPVASDTFVNLVPDEQLCEPCDCPDSALAAAQTALQTRPGLSVPALLDMTRDKRPSVRVYGLLMIMRLYAVTAIEALARLQEDPAQVTIASNHAYPPDSTQVRNIAALTPQLAIRYALWYRPSSSGADSTELQLRQALYEICASEISDATFPAPLLISSDGWDRPFRVSTVGSRERQVVLWSAGPNGQFGDTDDIIRYLSNCRNVPEVKAVPLKWTAAGGGTTEVLPEKPYICP